MPMRHITSKTVLWFALLIPLLSALYSSGSSRQPVAFSSNFNLEKTSSSEHSPIKLEEPLPLPIILTNPGEYKSNRPLFQKYSLRKYQLYDTKYEPDMNKITRLDEELAYNMQPPTGVFEECSKIVIENYRLLQIKEFKITLINPSERYRFCVEEIFIDSQQITRQQKRPLPFCINSTTKFPFFFSLYITEHKPLIFKGTVYFIVTIYDGEELVDEKIWPKQIIVKVTHNHLRIIPLQIRNCNKDNSIVMIRNPEKWDLSLVIIYKRKLYELTGEPIDGNIVIPAQKSYKFIIDGKDSKMTVYTKSVATDITYPVLYVPIYCIQDLIVDYFNIGILSDDRSLLEFPVTVSSYSNHTIYIQEITLKSSTETVQLLPLRQKFHNYEIEPNVRHFIVCRIVIHGSKVNVQAQRSYFQVGIKYMMKADHKQDENTHELSSSKSHHQVEYDIRQTKTTFHYCEMRSPISVGGKRFIDISKLNDGVATSVAENAFPIRNNLNLPINLIRVIYDEAKFKLLWLQDRRDYIFPNHQRDEFSLQYIGPRNLLISPLKYVALLQFNGNLFIPLQIIVYDRTLQCVYDDIDNGKPTKCSDLVGVEFGYFNEYPKEKQLSSAGNNKTKSAQKKQPHKVDTTLDQLPQTKVRRIAIRNWNPEAKNIKVGIEQNSVQKYGFNTSVRIVGPFPQYDVYIKSQGNLHEFYLKGNHYIVLQIQMTPLRNATSGTLPLRILTAQQHITKPIKFKVQNGTIALIPLISRFQSAFKKSIQYLNLVSTYKQPYRIKSITSNQSNLIVYSNNHSEIYENQWIGMALIHEPFVGEWNITEDCCTERKGVERIFRDLKVGSNKPTPVEIKLKTTTELQTSALVLIDRSSPPLIALPYNTQFSIREKFRKDAQRIDIHMIDDSNMQKFQYRLKIINYFQTPLKGSIMMFDEDLIERLEEYDSYRAEMNQKVVGYFCLRNDVKVKHNFSPSLIRTLFQLALLPVEITVEPLTNTSFYINSPVPPREEVVDASLFSEYFRETINSGSRMCYKFQTPLFIRNLIETGVVNWFSEEYRFEVLSQFIKKQFQQLQSQLQQPEPTPPLYSFQHKDVTLSSTKYNLHYDEFFAQHYIDREHFCKGERNLEKMTALFRFCQHVNIKMAYLEAGGNVSKGEEAVKGVKQSSQVNREECVNATGDRAKDCKRERESTKKTKKPTNPQANKYFLLPPAEQPSTLTQQTKPTNNQRSLNKNQLQLGFEIYPIRHRAPIFTFSAHKYRSLVENPHMPKEVQADKEEWVGKGKRLSEQSEEPLFLTTPSFYLVLLNNYTSYQLYHQTIQISKPKLRVKSVIINSEMIDKNEFQKNYFRQEIAQFDHSQKQGFHLKDSTHFKDPNSNFKDPNSNFKDSSSLNLINKMKKKLSHAEKSRWLPIYIEEKEIRLSSFCHKFQSTQNTDHPQPKPTSPERNNLAFQFNPEQQKQKVMELLQSGSIDNLVIEGEKVFEIANEGQADISYTHIGFENVERTCVYQGIRVITGPCTDDWQPVVELGNETTAGYPHKALQLNTSTPQITYKLLPKSSSLIKIRYSIPLKSLITSQSSQSQPPNFSTLPVSVYLYNSDSYFIQFVVKYKLSHQLQTLMNSVATRRYSVEGEKFFLTKIWNILLNVMAVVFICGTIVKFREDEEMAKRAMYKKSLLEPSPKLHYPLNAPSSYQKAYKRMKLKSDFSTTHQPSKQPNQTTYHIIQPTLYPFTIGTPITHKSSTSYHPIVTISEQLLNSIKQQQRNQNKLLHNYFNQSEESQILAKHEHQVHQNISLTINLDDGNQQEERQNLHNDSVSEESSFQFQIRNTSTSHDQQIGKHPTPIRQHSQSHSHDSDHNSGSDFSHASESDLPDGEQVEVTEEILNESDEGFGFESGTKKKTVVNTQATEEETQEKKEGYYNVFFSQNPLKKGKEQNEGSPFSWMNENKKRSRLKW